MVAILLDKENELKVYRTSHEPDLKEEKVLFLESSTVIIAIDNDAVWSVNQSEDDGTFIQRISLWSDEKNIVNKLDSSPYHNSPQVHSFHLNGKNLLVMLKSPLEFSYHIYQLRNDSGLTKLKSNSFQASNQAKEGRINIIGSLICIVDDDTILLINVETNFITKYGCSAIESSHVFWSINEPRSFVIVINGFATVFICSEKNTILKMYTQIALDDDTRLIGYKLPHIYLYQPSSSELQSHTIDEFLDLNEEAIDVIMDFITGGTLDLSKFVQNLGVDTASASKKVWENLAKIAVRSRDVKTGIFCMSKMRNARVVQDMKNRLSTDHHDLKAVALMAMNLNLYDEAEKYLKECGDKHALSQYYQSRNQWLKALDCVDKLNYKNLCHNYAKYLENEEGNLNEAIKYYQLSGTHVFEVPRMLFDVEDNSILESYCIGEGCGNCDPEDKIKLIQWWGQYCESLGHINEALKAYENAKDYYNLVRLLCYTGQTERARTVLASHDTNGSTSMEAAMLHLGRHMETSSPLEAISYYLTSGAVSHAIRVCKSNNLVKDLAKIIINFGNRDDAIDFVENYCSQNDEIDDGLLVQLYYQCSLLDTAVQLCLKAKLWSQLRDILNKEMDLIKSSRGNLQYLSEPTVSMALEQLKSDSTIIDVVIDLILLSKGEKSSIKDVIIESNVEISEQLIEKVEKIVGKNEDNNLKVILAETALKQGQYFVAAKLYNSIDDRLNSVKALIRTGETKKLIQYANIARDKNVFKVVANYLQTINYQDSNLISTFYQKAGAANELQRFKSGRN